MASNLQGCVRRIEISVFDPHSESLVGTFRKWLIWPTMSVDGYEADLAGTNPKKTPSRHWREDCDQVINLEVTGPRSVVWQVSVMIFRPCRNASIMQFS